jgi:hypothetical protein
MDTITSSTGGPQTEKKQSIVQNTGGKESFAENYQQNTSNLFSKMNQYVNKFETLSQSEASSANFGQHQLEN